MNEKYNKTIDLSSQQVKKTPFLKAFKKKLFLSEMPISKLMTQITLAGILISIAVIIERFVMIKSGPFEICFGFFVVLLFPLLIDFRISVIAALISVTLTEFLISGENNFWIHYIGILVSFPIIKLFMLFNKKYLYAIGLVVGMVAYVLCASIAMKFYKGEAFELMFMASKTIQMLIAIPIAISLYIPIKRALPNKLENSWEDEVCCEECEPAVNKNQTCCDEECESVEQVTCQDSCEKSCKEDSK